MSPEKMTKLPAYVCFTFPSLPKRAGYRNKRENHHLTCPVYYPSSPPGMHSTNPQLRSTYTTPAQPPRSHIFVTHVPGLPANRPLCGRQASQLPRRCAAQNQTEKKMGVAASAGLHRPTGPLTGPVHPSLLQCSTQKKSGQKSPSPPLTSPSPSKCSPSPTK